MARLDDGCCFVFSLLILSKQLAVYSFFLFRFIGASICISLAIPFLSIDPGWLGEDRPAAAFTLQVNLPDRRLFHSLFTRQGRAYISIGCLFLLLSYVRDLATYVADQSNRRGSRDEGKKLDRPSHTVLRNAFFLSRLRLFSSHYSRASSLPFDTGADWASYDGTLTGPKNIISMKINPL